MNKELYLKSFKIKNHIDDYTDEYIRKAFEYGDTLYLYRTMKHSLGKNNKYGWIQNVEHDEYDKIIINASDKRYSSEYIPKGDKCVYAFDMKNDAVKQAIKENYKFPIGCVVGDFTCKIKSDDFFSDYPEYDRYNVVVAKNDNILLDGNVHEFIMMLDSKIIYEVDKKHESMER